MINIHAIFILCLLTNSVTAQNKMTGDGFGGRLWYNPFKIGVGSYSGFAICGDSNQLYGWGSNFLGQLGNGKKDTITATTKTLEMTNVRYFSSGYCTGAIKEDRSAWVWGNKFPAAPVKIASNVRYLDANTDYISFVLTDGTIKSVGNSSSGIFGNGNNPGFYMSNPAVMQGISTAVRVSGGLYTNIALLSDSTVWVTGVSPYGIGLAGVKSTYTPLKIPTLKNVVEIQSSAQMNIALDSAGDVYIWGLDYVDSNNIIHSNDTPFRINSLQNIVAISACNDGDFFMALDKDYNCYAWGSNHYGQCGVGTSANWVKNPVLVATDVVDIMTGETFAYIVKKDFSLWATGTSNIGSIWLNLPNIRRDSFVKLDITSAPYNLCPLQNDGPIQIKQKFKICSGDSIKIGTSIYKITGSYIDSLKTSSGKDSFVFTELTVLKHAQFSQDLTICSYDSVVIGKNTYRKAGTFSDTLTNDVGCDSIVTTNIKLNHPTFSNKDIFLCPGDSSKFNNQFYSKPGLFRDTLINRAGCDSIINIAVNVRSDLSLCSGRIYFIPKAFSPNNDELNDYFGVIGAGIKNVEMRIYNLWGQKLFDGASSNLVWDGKYLKADCIAGVYVYIVKITWEDDSLLETSGSFRLIR